MRAWSGARPLGATVADMNGVREVFELRPREKLWTWDSGTASNRRAERAEDSLGAWEEGVGELAAVTAHAFARAGVRHPDLYTTLGCKMLHRTQVRRSQHSTEASTSAVRRDATSVAHSLSLLVRDGVSHAPFSDSQRNESQRLALELVRFVASTFPARRPGDPAAPPTIGGLRDLAQAVAAAANLLPDGQPDVGPVEVLLDLCRALSGVGQRMRASLAARARLDPRLKGRAGPTAASAKAETTAPGTKAATATATDAAGASACLPEMGTFSKEWQLQLQAAQAAVLSASATRAATLWGRRRRRRARAAGGALAELRLHCDFAATCLASWAAAGLLPRGTAAAALHAVCQAETALGPQPVWEAPKTELARCAAASGGGLVDAVRTLLGPRTEPQRAPPAATGGKHWRRPRPGPGRAASARVSAQGSSSGSEGPASARVSAQRVSAQGQPAAHKGSEPASARVSAQRVSAQGQPAAHKGSEPASARASAQGDSSEPQGTGSVRIPAQGHPAAGKGSSGCDGPAAVRVEPAPLRRGSPRAAPTAAEAAARLTEDRLLGRGGAPLADRDLAALLHTFASSSSGGAGTLGSVLAAHQYAGSPSFRDVPVILWSAAKLAVAVPAHHWVALKQASCEAFDPANPPRGMYAYAKKGIPMVLYAAAVQQEGLQSARAAPPDLRSGAAETWPWRFFLRLLTQRPHNEAVLRAFSPVETASVIASMARGRVKSGGVLADLPQRTVTVLLTHSARMGTGGSFEGHQLSGVLSACVSLSLAPPPFLFLTQAAESLKPERLRLSAAFALVTAWHQLGLSFVSPPDSVGAKALRRFQREPALMGQLLHRDRALFAKLVKETAAVGTNASAS
ncbi:hypothetical protein DIPPA_33224 [Diplonema papillatum]|nr:hypothetical protein DIPPA_33224 [Diplonema papillatum]